MLRDKHVSLIKGEIRVQHTLSNVSQVAARLSLIELLHTSRWKLSSFSLKFSSTFVNTAQGKHLARTQRCCDEGRETHDDRLWRKRKGFAEELSNMVRIIAFDLLL